MQSQHLVGGSLAFAGISILVVLITFILPKLKVRPQIKRIMTMALTGNGLLFIVLGAVISLLGEGWFE